MAEPFLGEVRIFSFNFPPKGWAFCNGQLLPISQNQALFSILGTTYGGDGRVNFALPNLQGRTPVHTGSGITLGELGGETAHTLSVSELPTQNHVPVGSSSAGSTGPGGQLVGYRQLWLQSLQHRGGKYGDESHQRPGHRRQPAASEHVALSGAQFLHRASGNFPQPQLAKENELYGRSILIGNPNFCRKLCPYRLGAMRRPAPAHQPEHSSLLLLGTNYGGDGKSTFALPNLQGSAPMAAGQRPGLSLRSLGESGGEQNVTLTATEMPSHTHTAQADAAGGGDAVPTNNSWGASGGRGRPGAPYAPSSPSNVQMSPNGTSPTGGGLPHNNMPPYLCMTFIIALQGIFPARG